MNAVLKFKKRYSVSVPSKLIVISKYSHVLEKIKNTYGGIYSIIPIEISNVFSKNNINASDVDISGSFPEINVRVEYFDSIDFEKCTYCGDCYRVCPEKCIDYNLDINLNKCTYCNKCSDVCKYDAINVSTVKIENFQAPFIITDLEEVLEKYSDVSGVYKIEDLEKVFNLTGEFAVEESIVHNENICQYSGKLGYGCKRCLDACEHDALYVENERININHILCVSCGKCVSVCPTGAMQLSDLTDYDFINEIKKSESNNIFVFGNEKDIRKVKWDYKDSDVENLLLFESDSNFLNLMHYLFLFAVGFSKVIVLNERLRDNNQIKFTNKLIDYLFNYPEFISNEINKHSLTGKKSNPLEFTYSNFSYSGRRDKLSNILKFLYENSDVKDILIKEDFLNIFGEVKVDESKCSLCLSCVAHCKIGALTSDEENYSLNHNPSICIQCKICENVCPEDAIVLNAGLLLSDSFFIEKELCSDEPIVCPGCGKAFGSKKTFERVKEKLTASGLFDTKGKFLNYCEECRVKRIFEEY